MFRIYNYNFTFTKLSPIFDCMWLIYWLCLGWIPGLGFAIIVFCKRFFYFQKLEMNQSITLILETSKFLHNSLGNGFWNICEIFEIAWVASICVGNSLPKSPSTLVLLCRSFSYVKFGVLIWFYLNPRNFNPRKIHFLGSFLTITFYGVQRRP